MPAVPTDVGTSACRVLIVEDEAIVSRDIQRMLRGAGYVVAASCGTTEGARQWLAHDTPDLALIDVALPEGRMAGIELGNLLRGRAVRVVFVTAHADRETITRAKALSPAGYLVKPFTEAQLLTAVAFALLQPASGGPSVDILTKALAGIDDRLGQLTTMLIEAGVATGASALAGASQRAQALYQLSSRERDVLRLLLANKRVPQIAERLFISQHTVRTHLKSIFRKLDVHSQAELIDRLSHDG